MYISINGKLCKEKDAKISVLDHGLLLGDGIFETLRTINGKLFKFDEHYNRLIKSAKQILLPVPISKETLRKQIEITIKANKLKEARVRITVTRGIGPAGLSINCHSQQLIITTEELKPTSYENGVKVITYELERNLPSIKSLSFLPSVVAKIESSKKNAFEAILIDSKGYAREGSFSNFFIVTNKKIFTPKENILKGITRDLVIKIAKRNRMNVNERNIRKKELLNADEAFITFTTGGIVPIIKVDNRNKKIGDVTKKLIELYKMDWMNLQSKVLQIFQVF